MKLSQTYKQQHTSTWTHTMHMQRKCNNNITRNNTITVNNIETTTGSICVMKERGREKRPFNVSTCWTHVTHALPFVFMRELV